MAHYRVLASLYPDPANRLSSALNSWLELRAHDWDPTTTATRRYWIHAWIHGLGDMDLAAIKPLDLQRLYSRLDNGRRGGETLNRMRTEFRSFWRWAHGLELVTHDPLAGWPRKRRTDKRRVRLFVSRGWVERIACAMTPAYSRLVWFLFLTGLRITEAISLRWRMIVPSPRDPSKHFLAVPAALRKGHRQDMVYPISRRALEALGRTGSPDDLIFPRATSWRTPGISGTLSGIDACFKRAARRAGYPQWMHFTPHQLRRSCTTALLNSGMQPLAVQRLLGWSSLEVMDIHYYGGPGEDMIRDFLDRI